VKACPYSGCLDGGSRDALNQTPETAARRYLQASEFRTDVSGQFFASAQGKFSGPMEVQRQPHL